MVLFFWTGKNTMPSHHFQIEIEENVFTVSKTEDQVPRAVYTC
jgi:hypothetical protein